MKDFYTAIGLMSGTSLDGIDVALIKSDGEKILQRQKFCYFPYIAEFKNKLLDLINNRKLSLSYIKEVELEFTRKNIATITNFVQENNLAREQIDVIGFHGHTILHQPQQMITWQIGNAQMLASATGINVVADFRSRDVVLGGQGAPLVPVYHHYLFSDYAKPLLILNIGGVSNLTYIGSNNVEDLIAFDNCFGNAPSDDLMRSRLGKDYDHNGELARQGKVNFKIATEFLADDFFKKLPPKSLDRNQFLHLLPALTVLDLPDALATLAYILAKTVADSLQFLPAKPQQIILCGGGRKNAVVSGLIAELTGIATVNIDSLGINGDALEAEAFAFLAIRHLKNLPISFTKTTGVSPAKHIVPTSESPYLSSCGGVFYRA